MDKKSTLPFDKGTVRMIAHRGLSGSEPENSTTAFKAAGEHSYYGIETDVHRTLDGKYVLIHDGSTRRVADGSLSVEGSRLDDLQKLHLLDKGVVRQDLTLPTPQEYFAICRRFGKVPVFELKSDFTKRELTKLIEIARTEGVLADTVFISFNLANLLKLRDLLPDAAAQYLTDKPADRSLIGLLRQHKLDLDIREDRLDRETVDALHAVGITVNCWTVDDPRRACELAAMGVDMITTDILE